MIAHDRMTGWEKHAQVRLVLAASGSIATVSWQNVLETGCLRGAVLSEITHDPESYPRLVHTGV